MKFVGCLVVLVSVGVADASEFGYTVYGSNLKINDPDGSTNSIGYFAPFNGFYADLLKRDLRYHVEAFTDSVILDAGVNHIGQKVKYQGIGISLQHRVRLLSEMKPWFGVGIDYVDIHYRERHTVDQGGFLDNRYPNSDEAVVNAVLNMAAYWEFTHSWDIGIAAKLSQSISTDMTSSNVGMSVRYKL